MTENPCHARLGFIDFFLIGWTIIFYSVSLVELAKTLI